MVRSLYIPSSCLVISTLIIITGFCLRFAEEFEVNLDDWKPDMVDLPVMNACVVEKGTYKVCSKTTPKTADGA